jgi:hypothetical protein
MQNISQNEINRLGSSQIQTGRPVWHPRNCEENVQNFGEILRIVFGASEFSYRCGEARQASQKEL